MLRRRQVLMCIAGSLFPSSTVLAQVGLVSPGTAARAISALQDLTSTLEWFEWAESALVMWNSGASLPPSPGSQGVIRDLDDRINRLQRSVRDALPEVPTELPVPPAMPAGRESAEAIRVRLRESVSSLLGALNRIDRDIAAIEQIELSLGRISNGPDVLIGVAGVMKDVAETKAPIPGDLRVIFAYNWLDLEQAGLRLRGVVSDAGRLIKQRFEALSARKMDLAKVGQATLAVLDREQSELQKQVDFLKRKRDAYERYVEETKKHEHDLQTQQEELRRINTRIFAIERRLDELRVVLGRLNREISDLRQRKAQLDEVTRRGFSCRYEARHTEQQYNNGECQDHEGFRNFMNIRGDAARSSNATLQEINYKEVQIKQARDKEARENATLSSTRTTRERQQERIRTASAMLNERKNKQAAEAQELLNELWVGKAGVMLQESKLEGEQINAAL